VSDIEFGDDEAADAFDIEPAEPRQVLRKLAKIRARRGLTGLLDADEPGEVDAVGELLDWLRREGGVR